jgi:hypothetical protein
MKPRHRTKHTDLFIVRFWAQYSTQDVSEGSEGQTRIGGRVQRALDGEAHEFDDWNALVATLRTMLAATSPELVAGTTELAKPAPSACADSLEIEGE